MTSRPSSSSSEGPELEGCFEAVRALLEQTRTPWALAGALAALEYRATKRMTTDLDILVSWNPDLVQALLAEGFDVRVFDDEGEPHLMRTNRGGCAVDFIVATTDYQHLAIERAEHNRLTVEDVLVHKLIAWRPRDRDDVRSILSTGLAFDRDYVDHWATEWAVEDRWREAMSWRA
jgi:hypothetical protein